MQLETGQESHVERAAGLGLGMVVWRVVYQELRLQKLGRRWRGLTGLEMPYERQDHNPLLVAVSGHFWAVAQWH